MEEFPAGNRELGPLPSLVITQVKNILEMFQFISLNYRTCCFFLEGQLHIFIILDKENLTKEEAMQKGLNIR